MASPRSTYTRERTDKVLSSLSNGSTLAKSCKEHGVVTMTFYEWVEKDYDNLKQRYEKAKISHMEHLSEKIAETIEAPLSEEEKEYPIAFKRRELQMKRLQWELEKRHRHIYGNHVTVENKHTIDLQPALQRLKEGLSNYKILKTVESKDKDSENPLELSKLSKDEQYSVKAKKRI